MKRQISLSLTALRIVPLGLAAWCLVPLALATVVAPLTLLPEAAHAAETTGSESAVARVGENIRYLASDELEGRGPGTAGLQKAADYMRDEFKRLGLKSGVEDGSFLQSFDIAIDTVPVETKTSLVLKGPDEKTIAVELGKGFQPLAIGGAGQAEAGLVFAGYGISAPKLEYDDYEAADIEGKVLLILRREPQQDDEQSKFDGKKTTQHASIRAKLQEAKKRKAAAVLLVNDPFSTGGDMADQLTAPGGFGTGSMGIPFAHISQDLANQLLGTTPVKSGDTALKSLTEIETAIDDNLAPMTQPLNGWTAELQFTFERVNADVANVVGILEGEGPLAEETIVIGAHYDHLGYGPFGSRRPNERAIHNGADDNATGTSAVMELARRFAQRDKKPARRMVFIGFTAEERGIIGSNYYVEHPSVPLADTVAMLNFDMIGGLKEQGLLVGGVRSAKQFPGLVEKVNQDGQLKVNTAGPLGGSDHAGFYRKGVPVLFCFTGMTDLYHTPDDDFETINVEGVVKTIDFAERLLDELQALPERPEFVKGTPQPRGAGGLAYLGVVPDYAGTSEGLRVTDVNADSPAAKGGLKKDDVIVKFGDVAVADIQGLAEGLRKYKPGDRIKVVVQRDKQEQTLEVTLGRPMGRN